MTDFVSVLNSFLYKKNIEVYVTGSNAKLLSKDVITEFRGRGDEVHVYPLSFKEYVSAFDGDKYEAYNQYSRYGGLPLTLSFDNESEKTLYLKNLFTETYINDILERNNISNKEDLDELLNVLASQVGSLTNANKLTNIFNNEKDFNISYKTISKFIDCFIDAFILKI